MLTTSREFRGDALETVNLQSETDRLLLAIANEKKSFARLAAAAQACDDPKARRLYNQLALDELKHLLTLVTLMDDLADDWLARLDLTLPSANLPDPLPHTEETIRRFVSEEEESQRFFGHLADGMERDGLASMLESLQADEVNHRARLLSLLYGMEVDRPVKATRLPAWLRSIRRMLPVAQLH
jgi:rubrerythrin